MKLVALVIGPMLATVALAALAPSAGASGAACAGTSGSCPGLVCVFGPGTLPDACASRCTFQTDCCDGPLVRPFWCPPPE